MADIMQAFWAIKQWTFDGVTYDEDNGGPLDWDFEDTSNEIGDRVADQIYVANMLIPEREFGIVIVQRDPLLTITPGTKSDLVMTFKKDDGTEDEVITFKGMVYLSQRASGRKSTPAENTAIFRYESTGTGTSSDRITRA